ncbi:hypothetical protein [Clostridium pasteurianum]|uniref:Uncharacterized protein n=1 Tax=Clostridium pasteurianum BC1 TaxID=86416 RepID=R4K6Q9_CLOPA|nr:hypothetical protein [Clostridium pasteurianum]AGK97381.1 hypothetical protein Clopa_2521 [Clostridium pasteurianum BC1]
MKATQYSAELIKKDGATYTMFKIGHKCGPRIKELLFCLNAKLVKETKTYTAYELKGDKISLFMII